MGLGSFGAAGANDGPCGFFIYAGGVLVAPYVMLPGRSERLRNGCVLGIVEVSALVEVSRYMFVSIREILHRLWGRLWLFH